MCSMNQLILTFKESAFRDTAKLWHSHTHLPLSNICWCAVDRCWHSEWSCVAPGEWVFRVRYWEHRKAREGQGPGSGLWGREREGEEGGRVNISLWGRASRANIDLHTRLHAQVQISYSTEGRTMEQWHALSPGWIGPSAAGPTSTEFTPTGREWEKEKGLKRYSHCEQWSSLLQATHKMCKFH